MCWNVFAAFFVNTIFDIFVCIGLSHRHFYFILLKETVINRNPSGRNKTFPKCVFCCPPPSVWYTTDQQKEHKKVRKYFLSPLLLSFEMTRRLCRRVISEASRSEIVLVPIFLAPVLASSAQIILDENWRKPSRNDPEAPYLPQNPKFLQENPKHRQRKIEKTTKNRQQLHDY